MLVSRSVTVRQTWCTPVMTGPFGAFIFSTLIRPSYPAVKRTGTGFPRGCDSLQKPFLTGLDLAARSACALPRPYHSGCTSTSTPAASARTRSRPAGSESTRRPAGWPAGRHPHWRIARGRTGPLRGRDEGPGRQRIRYQLTAAAEARSGTVLGSAAWPSRLYLIGQAQAYSRRLRPRRRSIVRSRRRGRQAPAACHHRAVKRVTRFSRSRLPAPVGQSDQEPCSWKRRSRRPRWRRSRMMPWG